MLVLVASRLCLRRRAAARCASSIATIRPPLSIHEESTVSVQQPFMAIFNNLVLFDQQKPLQSMDTIVPDLAESWAWDDSKTKLTFKLRQGVKWHDGKPFTSADVKCTFDLLLGKAKDQLRQEPARHLVSQPEGRHGQRRPRGDVRPREAAAVDPDDAGVGLYADLSLPCLDPGHAHQADRHRAVQVRRVQGATRGCRLVRNPDYWQEGQALPRRHRVQDHPEPLDADALLRRQGVRHDLLERRDDPAAEGHQGAGAGRRLRAASRNT